MHRFLPTLLPLHGTWGDENDLMNLGRGLQRGAALLSLRGKVLENGLALPPFLEPHRASIEVGLRPIQPVRMELLSRGRAS